MYTIEYAQSVIDDVAHLRTYDRAKILDSIEVQLLHEPTQPTRNKKIIVGLVPAHLL